MGAAVAVGCSRGASIGSLYLKIKNSDAIDRLSRRALVAENTTCACCRETTAQTIVFLKTINILLVLLNRNSLRSSPAARSARRVFCNKSWARQSIDCLATLKTIARQSLCAQMLHWL